MQAQIKYQQRICTFDRKVGNPYNYVVTCAFDCRKGENIICSRAKNN